MNATDRADESSANIPYPCHQATRRKSHRQHHPTSRPLFGSRSPKRSDIVINRSPSGRRVPPHAQTDALWEAQDLGRHPRCDGSRRSPRLGRPRVGSAGRPIAGQRGDDHTHQAPGRDLPGERVLRSLLRHLPERRQPALASRRSRPRPARRRVNGLTPALLPHNPNSVQPSRLDRSEAVTCDQDHDYTAEQQAFDGGLMDKFVQITGVGRARRRTRPPQAIVMGYYDGNTVTGAVELRAALRDERQLATARTSGRRRPARSTWSPARPTASTPADLAGRRGNGTDHRRPAPAARRLLQPGTTIGD